MLDLNQVPKSTANLIPKDTRATVILSVVPGGHGPGDALELTKSGFYRLAVKFVVMGGPHDKRSFFERFWVGPQDESATPTEGQLSQMARSRKTLKAILEAHHRISPVDDSPEALAKRQLTSWYDLNEVKVDIIVGVEESKDPQYDDKNVVKRVINPLKDPASRSPFPGTAAPAAAAPAARSKWGS